jgi:hypothetical protein
LISILSLGPEVLTSTCCSQLSGFQLHFLFDLRKISLAGFLFNYFIMGFSISLLNSPLISFAVFFI